MIDFEVQKRWIISQVLVNCCKQDIDEIRAVWGNYRVELETDDKVANDFIVGYILNGCKGVNKLTPGELIEEIVSSGELEDQLGLCFELIEPVVSLTCYEALIKGGEDFQELNVLEEKIKEAKEKK